MTVEIPVDHPLTKGTDIKLRILGRDQDQDNLGPSRTVPSPERSVCRSLDVSDY